MRLFKILSASFGILVALMITNQIIATFFNSSNSLLKVETPDSKSKIYLEGKSLGETPVFAKNLKSGDLDLKIESSLNGSKISFETKVTLSAQNLTSVNYEFGPTKNFSSGDIRTFGFGKGLSIISTPNESTVFLDGENVGKTPLSLKPTSGIHKIRLQLPGYFSRELEVNIDPTLRLITQIFLAQNPFDKFEKMQDAKVTIYDISSKNSSLASDTKIWSLSIFHFQKIKNVTFDSLVDSSGNTFFAKRENFDKKVKEGSNITIGYIGASWPMSEAASGSLARLTGTTVSTPNSPTLTTVQVQILQTPTGTLNVRSGAGSNNSIIAKVNPGQIFSLLEENNGWYKIDTGSVQGWISSQYAKKL